MQKKEIKVHIFQFKESEQGAIGQRHKWAVPKPIYVDAEHGDAVVSTWSPPDHYQPYTMTLELDEVKSNPFKLTKEGKLPPAYVGWAELF
jgi:hypothetical protein